MKSLFELKISFYIVFILILLCGCSSKPILNKYIPTNKQIAFKEPQIVYKGGSENSTQFVRDKYFKQTTEFKYNIKRSKNLNSFALIIGIKDYKVNTDVAYADNSALAFAELAKTTFGVPEENIITLLNNDASSGQIKSKIELIRELPEKGGTIYFYYAGHGVPGKNGHAYMLPADMSADSIHLEPRLKLNNIYKRIATSMASHIYVFVDSCFSGKDDNDEILYKGVAPVLKSKITKIESNKLVVMTAGGIADFANDFPTKKHRLFSYYLIEELAKGETDLQTIYRNIKLKVKRTSLKKGIGYKQIPQIYGAGVRELF